MMDDNRCFLAANHIKSLENALLTVKYGARNALHSLRLGFIVESLRFPLNVTQQCFPRTVT